MTKTLPCCWDMAAATSLRAVGMSAIRRHPAAPTVGLGRAPEAMAVLAAAVDGRGEPVADDVGGTEQPMSTAAQMPARLRITLSP